MIPRLGEAFQGSDGHGETAALATSDVGAGLSRQARPQRQRSPHARPGPSVQRERSSAMMAAVASPPMTSALAARPTPQASGAAGMKRSVRDPHIRWDATTGGMRYGIFVDDDRPRHPKRVLRSWLVPIRPVMGCRAFRDPPGGYDQRSFGHSALREGSLPVGRAPLWREEEGVFYRTKLIGVASA